MAADIHKIIAGINPSVYCAPGEDEEGIKLFKEVVALAKEGKYEEAISKAKPRDASYLDPDKAYTSSPIEANWLKDPVEKHKIVYDSPGENLEPVYFWILDYLQNNKYVSVEKIVDNFASSVGSGHFSEMGMKATKMQEEAMKMLGNVNTVIKSIINILYDLKEFKMRLALYEKYNSKDINEKRDAMISLKQIWMDTVDAKRGNTGLKAMSVQYQYVTLVDAFMVAENSDQASKMDLNDRVKRIVESRLREFGDWVRESDKELKKRFEIEKIYLKSQVNSVQLYSRWLKPYLTASRALEQRDIKTSDTFTNPDIVTGFPTTVFELVLLAEGEYKTVDDVGKGDLPEMFLKLNKRKYSPYIVVEYKFRTIPGKIQGQNYSFRGQAEISFTSYALNKEEAALIKKILIKSDLRDLNSYIEGATGESLKQLEDELAEYIDDYKEKKEKEEKEKKEKEEKEKKNQEVNPFTALFSIFKPSSWKSEKVDDKKDSKNKDKIPPDGDYDRIIRSQAALKGRQECLKLYGEFKKYQNMVG